MAKKITPEDYDQRLLDDGRGIVALEPYVDARTKILHQCSEGHDPWPAAPVNVDRAKHPCPACCEAATGKRPRGYWTLDRCKADALQHASITDWKNANSSAHTTACMRGWLKECTAHMDRRKRENWTDEELLADAKKYDSPKEWCEASPSAHTVSHKRGLEFHKKACAHMTRLRRETYTDAELLEDAKKYSSRSGWREGSQTAYQASVNRGPEFHNQACAHMHMGGLSDYDAIYFWEWMEDGVGTGIYKAGVTSSRLGETRIKECANKNKIDYRLIALCETDEGGALEIEKALLEMGETVALPDHIKDGRTEFRIYNDEELAFIQELLTGKQEALCNA